MSKKWTAVFVVLIICVLTACGPGEAAPDNSLAAGAAGTDGAAGQNDSLAAGVLGMDELPWWAWALALFIFTVILGVVAVITGVGGGVLYVPIVSAIFPFNFDFVRGAGLMVAMCGALAAGPKLLRKGLASMELGLPLALLSSVGSVLGARVGLVLPDRTVQTLLGFAVLLVVGFMITVKRSEFPEVRIPDRLSRMLGISGKYKEESEGREIDWTIRRTPIGMLLFLCIGFMGGIFGVGGGWANVPVLNLLLGAPVKVAIATSGFLISINSTAAVWVYLNSGAILALIAVPSVIGMMLGTTLGARLLPHLKPQIARWVVIGLLLFTGVRYILVGFRIIG